MKIVRIFFAAFVLNLCFNNYSNGQSNSDNVEALKSIAIILKITGEGNNITNSEISGFNIYNGIAKKLHETIPPKASDVLKIVVLDETKKNIFDGYFENPLSQSLESFEEGGIINNNFIYDSIGYLNIRFPVTANTKDIIINCYSIRKNKEELVSSLEFRIQ